MPLAAASAESPIATRIPLIVRTAVQRLCAIATRRLAPPRAVHRFVATFTPCSPQQVKAQTHFRQSKRRIGPFLTRRGRLKEIHSPLFPFRCNLWPVPPLLVSVPRNVREGPQLPARPNRRSPSAPTPSEVNLHEEPTECSAALCSSHRSDRRYRCGACSDTRHHGEGHLGQSGQGRPALYQPGHHQALL